MKKLRKMLGKMSDGCVESFMKLVDTQSKETLAKWSLDYAYEHFLPIFEKHCNDFKVREALDIAYSCLLGKKDFKDVRNLLLYQCQESAKALDKNPFAQTAARACGQATACLNTPSHTLGLVFYGAAAVVYNKVGLNEEAELYDSLAIEEIIKMEESLRQVAILDEKNPVKIKWYC